MLNLIKKIFVSSNDRELNRIRLIVEQINSFEDKISKLSDDQLRDKTDEFRKQISLKKEQIQPEIDKYNDTMSQVTSVKDKDALRGKMRDLKNRIFAEVLPEAFAVTREAAKRTIKLRHFDVQLIGGIVLHEGKIAEMTTGEGKTLVATLPAYLNALTGEGVHIVTVNDYLAKRDRDWMGPVFEFLGLSAGVIQHDMTPKDRQIQYSCDITYGTNNEFGFDYLRDNLVVSEKQIVQRKHNFAIVDEVDSILIDEARTPLIISGPVDTINTSFVENRPVVDYITRFQKTIIDDYIRKLKAIINKGGKEDDEEISKLLYIVHKGSPKEREFLDLILKNPKMKTLFDKASGELDSKMMISERQQILNDLYFTFDEKTREVDFTAKGEDVMREKFGIEFIIDDLEAKIAELTNNESLGTEEKIKAEEELTRQYVEQQRKVDSIKQLLKAYKLFDRDVAYVVHENKIVIVDEFTGRMMPGRRFSDGIHEAIEAKEKVEVQQESQTHATITLQNYFKMYEKLSGMTGTAETEAVEFHSIYDLDFVKVPTNKPLKRESLPDVIYKTEKEKFEAICNAIEELYAERRPVLVGTIALDKSEILSSMLKRRGVPHNVLNAKYHFMEASIVAQAGAEGAVTIATNMAGRGTDILLGGNPEALAKDAVNKLGIENREEYERVYRNYLSEYEDKIRRSHDNVIAKGGLFVMGTERHESRRIDNQLRGRSGRQGDPGTNKFYISLEDDLMRIFGSDRIKMIMERLGMEEGQEIEHPLVGRAIETAQKRVETRNFEIRQGLLKYDNVMNQQREMIYQRRRAAIKSENLRSEIENALGFAVETWLSDFETEDFVEAFRKRIFQKLLIMFKPEQIENLNRDELAEKVITTAMEAYDTRGKLMPPEKRLNIERMVTLSVIDANWKDYLYNIDQLREGINWRAYAQRDPLVEYKHEAFAMFKDLIDTIDQEIAEKIFKSFAAEEMFARKVFNTERETFIHERFSVMNNNASPAKKREPAPEMQIPGDSYKRETPKVGRNAPCPCGSGKKYKKCCGQ